MLNSDLKDFVPKGVEQFGCLSQDLILEYKKYLVLLIWEQHPILWYQLKRKRGNDMGKYGKN
jgi:hypothetical protein